MDKADSIVTPLTRTTRSGSTQHEPDAGAPQWQMTAVASATSEAIYNNVLPSQSLKARHSSDSSSSNA